MGELRLCFLRIFALARSKSGHVRDFGRWEEGRWRWDIRLMRRVFDWEVDIWNNFMGIIEGFFPLEGMKDRVIWAPAGLEKFSCRSFRRFVAREWSISEKWKTLWVLSIPLKVKCFAWLL